MSWTLRVWPAKIIEHELFGHWSAPCLETMTINYVIINVGVMNGALTGFLGRWGDRVLSVKKVKTQFFQLVKTEENN